MALNVMRDPKDFMESKGIMDPRNFRDPEAMVDPKGVVNRKNSNPRANVDPKGVVNRKNSNPVDPRGGMDSRNIMDAKPVVDSRGIVDQRTITKGAMDPMDIVDLNNTTDPKDIMAPKLGMTPDLQKKIFAIDLGLNHLDDESSSSKTGIDRKMLRFKIHYFLLLAGLGAVAPFTAVFAQKSLGLSATSFALAVTLQQFSSVFIKLLIGYLANFLGRLKLLIGFLATGQVLLNFVLFEMPAVPTHVEPFPFPPLVSYVWCEERGDTPKSKDLLLNKISRREECFPNWTSSVSDELRMISIPPTCESLPIYTNSTPPPKKDGVDVFTCQHNTSVLCSIHPSWCVLCCSNITQYYLIETSSEEMSEEVVDQFIQSDFQTLQFWLFALVFSALYACTYSMFTLSDTACCESVAGDFTHLKMCGPMAWGVMSAFGGFLSYQTGSFLPACAVMACMTILMLWNLSRLELAKPTFSEKIFHDVKVVFGSKEFVAFQIGVLLNAIGHGIIWFYLIWFLTSMDGSLLLCGLVHTVQCLAGEVPFLFFSEWMVRKMGHFNATSLSLLAYSARFFWYSQLRNAWHVLPIEFTHGITFGVYYTTVTSFTKFKAKKGAEANTLSAMFTTFNGLGAGIGNILAGVCIDYFGGHRPFFYFGVAFGLFSVINIIYTFITRNDNRIIIKIIPPPED